MNVVTGADVCDFLGRAADKVFEAKAQQNVRLIADMVKGYTRGQGFDPRGLIQDDLRAVIIAVTARLMANPEHFDRVQIGEFTRAGGGFQGFTLPEQAVLHNHRRRTA